jgi:hypothetical protein
MSPEQRAKWFPAGQQMRSPEEIALPEYVLHAIDRIRSGIHPTTLQPINQDEQVRLMGGYLT